MNDMESRSEFENLGICDINPSQFIRLVSFCSGAVTFVIAACCFDSGTGSLANCREKNILAIIKLIAV